MKFEVGDILQHKLSGEGVTVVVAETAKGSVYMTPHYKLSKGAKPSIRFSQEEVELVFKKVA